MSATATPAPGLLPPGVPTRRGVPFRHPGLAVGGFAAGGAAVVGAGATFGPAAACAALIAVLAGVGVVCRPVWAAYVLVAVVPAVSGLKRDFPVPGLKLSEILIGGIATIILVTAGRRDAARWRSFDWLALAYCIATAAFGTINMVVRDEQLSAIALGTLFGPFQFFILYRAVVTALRTPEQRRRALVLAVLASVPVALLAISQSTGIGNVRGLLNTLTDPEPPAIFTYYLQGGVGRATGPFAHPHTLAAYEFMIILLSSGMLLVRAVTGRMAWLVGGCLLIAVGGLLTSATATPMIAACIGIVAMAAMLGRLKVVLPVFAVVAAIGLAVAGGSITGRFAQEYENQPQAASGSVLPQSVAYRVGVWQSQYLPAMRHRWLAGYGPDIPPEITWKFTESLYLTLLLRGGLPLLFVYAALMVALYKASKRLRADEDPARRITAMVVGLSVLLFIPMHLVEPYFVTTGSPHLLWALTGVFLFSTSRGERPRLTLPIRKELHASHR